MRKVLIYAVAIALAGCASRDAPIKALPEAGTPQTLPITIDDQRFVKELRADAENLDNAVAVGALPKDDPAPPCVHDLMVKAGIDAPAGDPPKSFVPNQDGGMSIAYIKMRQAELTMGLAAPQISTSCFALYGQIRFNAILNAVRIARTLRNPLLPLPLR